MELRSVFALLENNCLTYKKFRFSRNILIYEPRMARNTAKLTGNLLDLEYTFQT